MITRTLPKKEWESYFDRYTSSRVKGQAPEFTRIEVLSSDMGAQIETSKERLLGLTYDPKDDAFEVEFDTFLHRIHHPKEIVVLEDSNGVLAGLKVLVEKLDMKVRKGREEVFSFSHALGHQGLLAPPAVH
jgi:uncharacterized protein DUF5335